MTTMNSAVTIVHIPFFAAYNQHQATPALRTQAFEVNPELLSEAGRKLAELLAERQRGYSAAISYNPRHELDEMLRNETPERAARMEAAYSDSYPDTTRQKQVQRLFPFPACIDPATGKGVSYGVQGKIAPDFDAIAYIEDLAKGLDYETIGHYHH